MSFTGLRGCRWQGPVAMAGVGFGHIGFLPQMAGVGLDRAGQGGNEQGLQPGLQAR